MHSDGIQRWCADLPTRGVNVSAQLAPLTCTGLIQETHQLDAGVRGGSRGSVPAMVAIEFLDIVQEPLT
jgi:hypothetical protein